MELESFVLVTPFLPGNWVQVVSCKVYKVPRDIGATLHEDFFFFTLVNEVRDMINKNKYVIKVPS